MVVILRAAKAFADSKPIPLRAAHGMLRRYMSSLSCMIFSFHECLHNSHKKFLRVQTWLALLWERSDLFNRPCCFPSRPRPRILGADGTWAPHQTKMISCFLCGRRRRRGSQLLDVSLAQRSPACDVEKAEQPACQQIWPCASCLSALEWLLHSIRLVSCGFPRSLRDTKDLKGGRITGGEGRSNRQT